MSDYRPPLDDISFVLKHIVGYDEIAALPGFEHADLDTVEGLMAELSDLVVEKVAPLNRIGDTEGATWHPDHSVTTPPGFAAAYKAYQEAGWPSVAFPEEYGGGNFPWAVGLAMQEVLTSANMAFSLGPLLTQGAIEAISHYGSDEQKATYLPPMIAGEWSGTMNLTEPQAGSDVGALTAKAVKNPDGSYSITGQKIFISYGEHDFTDQKVHLVLARVEGAPAGTAGISCFVVPKYLVNDDGSLGEHNSLKALSIEHKMGIHASPTCVMDYDGATGFLLGEENKGMRIMFVMMNTARLSVGLEGMCIAERAYQQSLAYATDRIQGTAVGGSEPVAIIEHPDVRRMLMTQKSQIAALRALMLSNAGHMDRAKFHPDAAVREREAEIVGLLTPICKSLGTDLGSELSSLALQIHGGMGFIEETGVAQHYRDVRITAIYEGTNGIQAADLIGRKLPVRQGASVAEYLAEMAEVDADLAAAGDDFASIRAQYGSALGTLKTATEWLLRTGAGGDVNAMLAGSVPYQRMFGLVVSSWLLAREALAAAGTGDATLAETKLVLARFHAEQLLPAAGGLLGAVQAGTGDLFALDAAQLGS